MTPAVAGSDVLATATRALPSGTITFLFTDIEGSTKRWETHGDQMRVAVESHDSVMRAIFERHEGYIFKTVGDAFCVAFAGAPDALAAAVEAQRAIAREDHAAHCAHGHWHPRRSD